MACMDDGAYTMIYRPRQPVQLSLSLGLEVDCFKVTIRTPQGNLRGFCIAGTKRRAFRYAMQHFYHKGDRVFDDNVSYPLKTSDEIVLSPLTISNDLG